LHGDLLKKKERERERELESITCRKKEEDNDKRKHNRKERNNALSLDPISEFHRLPSSKLIKF
jgi:hypothetical protein